MLKINEFNFVVLRNVNKIKLQPLEGNKGAVRIEYENGSFDEIWLVRADWNDLKFRLEHSDRENR